MMIEWGDDRRRDSVARHFYGSRDGRHSRGIVGTLAAIGLGLAAAGSVASSAIGAHAASSAADAQVNAANQAAQLQHQDAAAALDFNKQVYGDQQKNIAPWLATGKGALSSLSYLMGIRPQMATSSTTPQPPAGNGINLSDLGGAFTNNPVINRLRGGGVTNPGFTPMQAQSTTAMMTPAGGQNFDGGPTSSTGIPGTAGPDGVMTPNGTIDASKGNLVTQFDPNGQTQIDPNTGQPFPQAAGGPDGKFGSLAQGFDEKFAAPTDVTEQNDPGYQFRLKQGQDAIEHSAAARGGLLSGGTGKALNDYAQGSASNEYGNVYNRALTEYQQRYNVFNNNQSTLFNRLANLSGFGQTATAQLNSAGTNAANNNSTILMNSGQQIGQQLNNAGAATASGYAGTANAINGGISGLSGLASLYALLNKGA